MDPTNKQALPSVLFVDDEKPILQAIRRFARTQPWSVSFAESGEQALELLNEREYAVVVSDMRMPGMNGADLLKKVREVQPLAIRILLSGYADINDVRSVVNDAGIFNYLSKPWCSESLLEVVNSAISSYESEKVQESENQKTKEKSVTLGKIALLLDKKAKERDIEVEQAMALVDCMHGQMQARFKDTVKVLNQIIDWKEGRDTMHSKFVMKYAELIAKKLKLDDEVDDIIAAAMLHRVGMVGMQDKFSSVPYFKLSKEEKEEYETYPLLGEAALAHAPSLNGVAKLIRHQKEYVNGTGGPDGLNFKEIPMGAQIIGLLSDFYELYRGKLELNISGVDSALEYMEQWVTKKYSESIFKIFKEELDHQCEFLSGSMLKSAGDLCEGMQLEQNIYSKVGAILVSRGTILTPTVIGKIHDLEGEHAAYFVSQTNMSPQVRVQE